MSWQTTYPTLATVMEAGFETLATWDDKLPAAQTDVERTIRNRIRKQIKVLIVPEIRKTAPELAETLERVYAQVRNLIDKASP